MIVVAALVATLGPVGTNDIGFHLRLGQEIAGGGPPRTDTHSFTLPGVAYPDHEWLAQLGLKGVYAAFGVPGLAVLQGTLIATTIGLVAWATRGPAALRALATLPVLLLAFDHSEVRPHLLGWIYIAAIALVPLLNPYGIHVYTLFLTITGNAGFVGEWQPYPSDSWQFGLLVVLTAG